MVEWKVNSNKVIIFQPVLLPWLILLVFSCVHHYDHVTVKGFSTTKHQCQHHLQSISTRCVTSQRSSSFPSSIRVFPTDTAIEIISWKAATVEVATTTTTTAIIDPIMTTTTFHLSVAAAAAVEIFDGSAIIDPVVVSNSFWSGLRKQILSVILGQLLAAVAFSILASFLAPQLSSLRDAILSKFNNDESNDTPFIKADSILRPEPDFGKLSICLLIDIIGTSSEVLPILGGLTDVISAPISATVLQNIFPGSSKFVFFFELLEELLPLTDIIPFATICWVIDAYYPESAVAGVFQLGGNYSRETIEKKQKQQDKMDDGD